MGKFLMGEENWLGINNEIPATGENDNEFVEYGQPESGRGGSNFDVGVPHTPNILSQISESYPICNAHGSTLNFIKGIIKRHRVLLHI